MLDTPELMKRAKAIRLSQAEIAKRTGLDPNTVGNTLSGKTDPRGSTCRRIAAEVEAEEIRMLRELVAIHGVPCG